jgi:hypothetical protein
MTPLRRTVDVIIERVPLVNRWVDERWQPAAVEATHDPETGDAASRPPGECETEPADASGNRWRCKGFEIELHPSEAEGYFLNLTSPDPRIFVMWRFFEDDRTPRARPVLVTVSYNQAARYMDGGEQVDAVPMLPAIADWMRPFIATHYKPEPRRKVRRNDPFAEDDANGSRNRR